MPEKLRALRWAVARVVFIAYIAFSVLTVVGGFLTAPLMTWYFYGDWRFWRHWRSAIGLLPHGIRLTGMMLGHGRAFMFSVPLTSPPHSAPDPNVTVARSDWHHGGSCGDCTNCCEPGGHACPLLDRKSGLCRGYDSFYWRYFNCGRFPTVTEELAYYDCRKWSLVGAGEPVPVAVNGLAGTAAGSRVVTRAEAPGCATCEGNCVCGNDLLSEAS